MTVPRLTAEQAAIITAYTGVLCGSFADFQAYAEKILGHPVWTHEIPALSPKIKEASREDFLSICHMKDVPT